MSAQRLAEGPPCGPGGPTLELQEMRYLKGKPPHRGAIVEVRVRNPLASPLWLLYDVDIGGKLPSVINAVTVSRTKAAPRTHLWSFDGDGGFQALHLPPGADVVLRDVELSSYSAEDRLLIAFATSIAIGDHPAESWAGQVGLSPASGEFTLATLVTELERTVDDMAGEPLGVRIVCVARFDSDHAGAVDGLP